MHNKSDIKKNLKMNHMPTITAQKEIKCALFVILDVDSLC